MMSVGRLPWKHKVFNQVREIELFDDLLLEQWVIPKGTKIKITETTNFGWVILPEGTRTVEGYLMHRRLFKF